MAANKRRIVDAAATAVVVEPQADCIVDAFHYYTAVAGDNWGSTPACLYLASDESGRPRGVQWWSFGAPTAFHGHWERGRGTLRVHFNCRGLVDEAGEPRWLKTTYVHLLPDSSWVGQDARRQEVKMVQYGSWVVRASNGLLVWEECPSLQHRLAIECA